MTLPATVAIGPIEYSVVADELTVAKAKVEGEEPTLIGRFDPMAQQIVLDPDQALGQMRVTLLHEVLHAVWWNTGLRPEFTATEEERAVNSLSVLLVDVLRRNPDLVAYLTGA